MGPPIKEVRIVFAPPLHPPPCQDFDPDLPNFYLLISCNIGISDPPPPKIFRHLLWMAHIKMSLSSLKMPALQKGLQLGSFFLKFEFNCLFSMFGSLKKYPKISGYLDRISKIWIMKKTDIHVSKYPCI